MVSRRPLRVTVEVAASSANLGAGFDSLALALGILARVEAMADPRLHPGDVAVSVEGEGEGEGEGAADLPTDGSDRFTTAFLGAIDDVGHGWRVRIKNRIPIRRGLGSSAAATVAGLVAARALSGTYERATDEELLATATRAEGHPENAAAALFGGFVVTTMTNGGLVWARIEPPPQLRVALFVPQRPLATDEMRKVLPDTVPRRDAVHNVGRAALAVAALATGHLDLLRAATDDRLHEPYRAAVYPELPALIAAARAAGAMGACLSGSGSTVLAFADSPTSARRVAHALDAGAADLGLAGRPLVVRPRSAGVRLVHGSHPT